MKSIFKKILQLAGYELCNISGRENTNREVFEQMVRQGNEPSAQKYLWLKNLHVTTIIDVGANNGLFAEKIRGIFPSAFIYSFEPLDIVYEELKLKFINDAKFLAYNFALGEKKEITTIFMNEYSPSSSLLKMGDIHKQNFDFAKKETPVEIRVERLDDFVLENNITLNEVLLIKIDVQGFEEFVIKGGVDTIKKAKILIIEVSFVELYMGQKLFDNIYKLITSLGFAYHGNFEQLASPEDGEILQADAVFIRES